jgi:predicted MFS family arabinose efflux permease
MAATSLMNTGGALVGIFGIPVVAFLSGHYQWSAAFGVGAALTVVSALAWLGIDVADLLREESAPCISRVGLPIVQPEP